jgi:hypothetical protein
MQSPCLQAGISKILRQMLLPVGFKIKQHLFYTENEGFNNLKAETKVVSCL